MMSAEAMIERLAQAGYGVIAGVPCSSLAGLIAGAIAHPQIQYVGAANEGDAVAIAAGGWLGGTRGAVFMQNSGLGNAVNPLTSLIDPFEIPMFLMIGWRGKPGIDDEPQHRLMGGITPSLLRHCGFEIGTLGSELSDAEDVRITSDGRLALLVEGQAFRSGGNRLQAPAKTREPSEIRDFRQGGQRATRAELIEVASDATPRDTAIFSTTGKCSRELFEHGDRPNYFYQVGSMGCVSSLALGFMLATKRRVVVLDGDGAALMRLGALATIGAHQSGCLIHIMLDNEAHDSTGGQPTVSNVIDLATIAGACGYASIARCNDAGGLAQALEWAFAKEFTTFIHAKVAQGSRPSLGRPSVSPAVVAHRFRKYFLESA